MRYACLGLLLASVSHAAPVVIENDRLAITVDADHHGAITSLRDKLAGRELLAEGAAPRLFQVEYTAADQPTAERQVISEQDADQVRVDQVGNDVVVVLGARKAGLHSAMVTFTTAPDSPFIRATVRLDFDPGLRLQALRFPMLSLGLLTDDALVAGATKGGLHHPSTWRAGKGLYLGQPGNLAAPFATYYDPRGGLVMAAFDPVGRPKTFAFNRGEQSLSIQGYTADFAASTYRLGYDFALTCLAPRSATEPADWHEAADLYKSWAETQRWCAKPLAERDDLPDWLMTGPAMVRFNRAWLAEPDSVRDWMRDTWGDKYPDVPLIVAFWGWEKVNTWVTPDYFPVYPSDEQFTALTADLKRLGGHSFCWPSGYHYTVTYRQQADGTFEWDDRERFARDIRQHAIVNADGSTYLRKPSWLQGGETSAVCPGDPWGLDWFNQIGAELARRGSEIVQLDQVVGGKFPACWSTTHGHPAGPGPWQAEVFATQLDQLRRVVRSYQPDGFVCVEEPNEVFIHQVGIQDYRDWEVMKDASVEPASVFEYLYHEYLPCFQSNPRAGDRLGIAWQIVTGQIPHLVPSKNDGPGPAMANGSLDAWSGNAPLGWDKVSGWQGVAYSGKAERESETKHQGDASLKLTNGPDDPVVQVSQNVMVGRGLEVGQTYRLRAWLRNGGTQQDNGINAATFATGMKSNGSIRLMFGQPDEGWVERAAEFTVPPGTELLRLMIHLSGPGTVWVDDLRLEVRDGDGWHEMARPAVPSDYAMLRKWVELYHSDGRPYLFLGRTLPPPPLECADVAHGDRTFPGILHNAYEAPDGSQAVILVNASDVAQLGTLRWQGAQRELTMEPWEIRMVR